MPPKPRVVPAVGSGEEWTKEVTALETAPTTTSHGVDCTHFETATLALEMDTVTSFTARIYGMPKGSESWIPSTENDITDAISTDGVLRNYDVSGLIRFAVRITAISATGITRIITLS